MTGPPPPDALRGEKGGSEALTRHEVRAVAAARGLAPEDLEIRLRADASSRTVVLVLYTIAIAWLLVAS
ncbi:MAG TPA: hypothetical protein VFY16_09470, partial [Gemmatimonadaceae bacterium]|nr:hypothetical protein [Gemmatimonadaceae bacterium]